MVRKHARRAVKAAFAVAFAIPIVLGGTANAKTTATDDHRRHEELHRGVRPRPALQAGARGEGLQGRLQGEHRQLGADRHGADEREDQLLPGVHGRHRAQPREGEERRRPRPQNYAAAKAFEEKRGYTLLKQTPFFDADSFAVLKTTATKYGLKTISDLKKVPNLSYAGYPECDKRITCLLGLKQIYGLTKIKFVQLGTIPVTKLIDHGQGHRRRHLHDRAGVRDRQVRRADRQQAHLRVPERGARGVEEARRGVRRRSSRTTVNAVSAKLTNAAMIAMNKAVAVDKKTPAAVAKAFLKANGLA